MAQILGFKTRTQTDDLEKKQKNNSLLPSGLLMGTVFCTASRSMSMASIYELRQKKVLIFFPATHV